MLAALQHTSTSRPIGTVAQKGTYIHTLKTNSVQNGWIVDSETSNDMTDNSQLFKYLSYLFPQLCPNKDVCLLQCEICELAKHHRPSFKCCNYKESQPFSIIHSDLWGPSCVPNRTNTKWFLIFINDHTRVCWVYLLKEKSEVPKIFIEFFFMIQN